MWCSNMMTACRKRFRHACGPHLGGLSAMNKESYRGVGAEQTRDKAFREKADIRHDEATDTSTRMRDSMSEAHELSLRHHRGARLKSSRRKWIGWGLLSLGLVTTIGVLPFYLIGAAYLGTGLFLGFSSVLLLAGLVVAITGGTLAMSKPKVGETGQALIIAMKHENTLTVTRLALEMDISFKKAERILQDLVKSGVAEIDLEKSDTEGTLVYRVRGL